MPHALLDAVAAHAAEFVALRRDIHRHPELGFEEFRTSDLVAERLAQWGYAVERGLGRVFLQVEESNTAALALYQRAGLTTAWHYHYWRKDG